MAMDYATLQASIQQAEGSLTDLDVERNFSFAAGEYIVACRTYVDRIEISMGRKDGSNSFSLAVSTLDDLHAFAALADTVKITASKLIDWQQGGAHP